MTARPCIDCGEATEATRCQPCTEVHTRRTETRRGTARDRGYSTAWDKLSRRARRRQPWCMDCGTTTDLTADHLRWPARTLADVEVVCQPCNNRRGAARGPNRRDLP